MPVFLCAPGLKEKSGAGMRCNGFFGTTGPPGIAAKPWSEDARPNPIFDKACSESIRGLSGYCMCSDMIPRYVDHGVTVPGGRTGDCASICKSAPVGVWDLPGVPVGTKKRSSRESARIWQTFQLSTALVLAIVAVAIVVFAVATRRQRELDLPQLAQLVRETRVPPARQYGYGFVYGPGYASV